jgi:hypothetical protein
MHRETANQLSGTPLRSSIHIGDHDRHGQDRNCGQVDPDGFALTTFLPGVEFEESEPPDALGVRV